MNDREKSMAEMVSKVLVEIADNNGHLLTILDLQARIMARVEGRALDDVVDEVNALLKENRRASIREVDEWAQGTSTLFEEDDPD